ncbi:MAG: hypothetical protein GY714_04245 [Desulfobacterales bacterium]|nr:hypothetical protein [Desulfobacterales bacterium]
MPKTNKILNEIPKALEPIDQSNVEDVLFNPEIIEPKKRSSFRRSLRKLYKHPIFFFRDIKLLNQLKSFVYIKQFLFIILPMLVTTIYLYGFSIEKYCSSTTYLIRDNKTTNTLGIDFGIFGSGSSSRTIDNKVLVTYLSSFDTLDSVDKKFKLNKLYHSDQTDILERLFTFSSKEDFLELYQKNLLIETDSKTGLTELSFMSNNPSMSKNIVGFLLIKGESFLNELNKNNAEKKISFIDIRLKENKRKMNVAIHNLKLFQNIHKIINPTANMEVQNSIIAKLEGSLVEKNAEKNQLLNYMNKNSLDILRLENEIKELKSSLHNVKSRLSGEKKERLNELFFQYEKLKAEADFSKEVYTKTLIQYEVGRIEALQESKILEIITTPTNPDSYSYPEKFRTLLTLFFLLIVSYKIISLIIIIVQDHKD